MTRICKGHVLAFSIQDLKRLRCLSFVIPLGVLALESAFTSIFFFMGMDAAGVSMGIVMLLCAVFAGWPMTRPLQTHECTEAWAEFQKTPESQEYLKQVQAQGRPVWNADLDEVKQWHIRLENERRDEQARQDCKRLHGMV